MTYLFSFTENKIKFANLGSNKNVYAYLAKFEGADLRTSIISVIIVIILYLRFSGVHYNGFQSLQFVRGQVLPVLDYLQQNITMIECFHCVQEFNYWRALSSVVDPGPFIGPRKQVDPLTGLVAGEDQTLKNWTRIQQKTHLYLKIIIIIKVFVKGKKTV